ncbi:MAG: hypothetical protein ABI889_09880 [Gemmatimonadota bacterium]
MIRTRVVVRGALSVIPICAIAASCRSGRAPKLGMADTTFVATLSDLRRVQADTALDVTMRDSNRRMVLRRHKVTSTQLEHAARVLAESPARASDLWREIESAQRPIVQQGVAPRPAGPPPGNNHPVPRP